MNLTSPILIRFIFLQFILFSTAFVPISYAQINSPLLNRGSTAGNTISVDTTSVSNATIVNTKSDSKPARLWNLQDADIISVINEVSQETGKNFVIDPRVTGKISLISSKPLHQSEVYQVFLSVLGMLGYSAIPSGNIIKIVPNMESSEQALPILTKSNGEKGEEVVIRIIPLVNVSATQLIPILRPLLPQWSNIAAYTPGNILILLGRASNLTRILSIIQDVDKATLNGIEVIPLRHASATQVATVLNNLQATTRNSGEASVSVAVDERSNSILLSGIKVTRVRMRALISQLDLPGTSSFGNTEVVYLKYLQAKTFAPLIGKIAQNILGKNTDNSSGSTTSSTLSSSGNVAAASGDKGREEAPNTTNIQAEPNTNALIITAPPALMRSLRAVIAKLDIRPAQVAVEAIIAEIDEGNISNLGIEWGGLTPIFGSSSSSSSTTTASANLIQGSIGILPGVHDLTAVLTMLQTLNGTDILSTPSIMVLDNQPAVIEIGQSIPTQTGSYTTPTAGQTGTSPTPFTTTDYKNVTLKLDVTPQINLGNTVRLKIKLKNDTIAGAPSAISGNPPINTSSISNTVLVNHEDILVLGGLIQNTTNESVVKIPLLADIPIIGNVFQRKNLTQTKKEFNGIYQT